ncbi:MAG: protein TolR [Deltaproteobacteria bacterium]|nr:protein TolR [Deltaproteobacteria bacterium]
MAFDESSGEGGAISQINVTPLVDVMLVLLVIFMVTAPILQQGVDLELPKETIAPIEGEGEQLVVSINSEGSVFIGEGNEVEVEKIGDRLQAILSTRQDKRVFIRGDRRVSYGRVMAVMARVRRAGIDKVGLITEPTA